MREVRLKNMVLGRSYYDTDDSDKVELRFDLYDGEYIGFKEIGSNEYVKNSDGIVWMSDTMSFYEM